MEIIAKINDNNDDNEGIYTVKNENNKVMALIKNLKYNQVKKNFKTENELLESNKNNDYINVFEIDKIYKSNESLFYDIFNFDSLKKNYINFIVHDSFNNNCVFRKNMMLHFLKKIMDNYYNSSENISFYFNAIYWDISGLNDALTGKINISIDDELDIKINSIDEFKKLIINLNNYINNINNNEKQGKLITRIKIIKDKITYNHYFIESEINKSIYFMKHMVYNIYNYILKGNAEKKLDENEIFNSFKEMGYQIKLLAILNNNFTDYNSNLLMMKNFEKIYKIMKISKISLKKISKKNISLENITEERNFLNKIENNIYKKPVNHQSNIKIEQLKKELFENKNNKFNNYLKELKNISQITQKENLKLKEKIELLNEKNIKLKDEKEANFMKFKNLEKLSNKNIDELNCKNDFLSNQIINKENQIHKLALSLKEFEIIGKNSNEKLIKFNNSLKENKEKISTLKNNINIKDNKINEFNIIIQNLKNEILQKNSQIQHLKTENSDLLLQLNTSNKNLDVEKQKTKDLSHIINHKEKELNNDIQIIEEIQAKNRDLEKNSFQNQLKINELNNIIENLKNKVSSNKTNYSSIHKENSQLLIQNQNQNQKWKGHIVQLTNQLKSYQQENLKLNNYIKILNNKNLKKNISINKFETKISRLFENRINNNNDFKNDECDNFWDIKTILDNQHNFINNLN